MVPAGNALGVLSRPPQADHIPPLKICGIKRRSKWDFLLNHQFEESIYRGNGKRNEINHIICVKSVTLINFAWTTVARPYESWRKSNFALLTLRWDADPPVGLMQGWCVLCCIKMRFNPCFDIIQHLLMFWFIEYFMVKTSIKFYRFIP